MSEEILNEEVTAESEAPAESREQPPEEQNASSGSDASALEESEKQALIESLLFVTGEPLSLELLNQITKIEVGELETLLAMIVEKHKAEESGIELVIVASQYQLRTKARFAPFIRALKDGGPRKLSAPALETLSIVAYRQPIVKSDIEKIRGVDATPTLKTLIERNLIKIVGHQASVGQPALYGTTDEFLKLFGLGSLSELPTLRDISEIESDPGESAEAEDEAEAGLPLEENTEAAPQ